MFSENVFGWHADLPLSRKLFSLAVSGAGVGASSLVLWFVTGDKSLLVGALVMLTIAVIAWPVARRAQRAERRLADARPLPRSRNMHAKRR